MPQLFDVPGWSVPSAPAPQPNTEKSSKKRKRPASDGSDMLASGFSLEKLMDKLKEKTADASANTSTAGKPKKKKNKSKGQGKEKEAGKGREQDRGDVKDKGKEQSKGKGKGSEKEKGGKNAVARKEISRPMPLKKASKSSLQDDKGSRPLKRQKTQDADAEKKVTKPRNSIAVVDSEEDANLTPMQRNMKQTLDGAKFRMINENLYKAESSQAVGMMKDDPTVYHEYHKGFRRQVQSWPTNPVNLYIEQLQDHAPKTVIADLGCGDAALAKALIPQGMVVLSYDLVSDGRYVVEADACQNIPLPGSEGSDSASSVGEAQVVDVVVCSLSLMNVNWPRCIKESWRVLKPGGELKIAEVASRFRSVKEFESLVASIGFKLQSKDEDNSHFTLFEFKKVARQPKDAKDWDRIYGKASILKPCEYKRR